MYVVNNEITITWTLAPTGSPLLATDYDIRIVPSDLDGTYNDASIINYDAPAADRGGSLQYSFTPLAPGRWTIFLATGTGAAQTVLDEKNIWVFPTAEIGSQASTKMFGALSNPQAPPFLTTTETFLAWRSIDGVCQDPTNPNVIWVSGWIEFADSNGSIASIDYVTGDVTVYDEVLSFTDNPVGIAMNTNGRLCVLDDSPVSNDYRGFYSDAPYTTWTEFTYNGLNITNTGQVDVYYDIVTDAFFWNTGTRLATSEDGADWHEQTMDRYADNVSEISVTSQSWVIRHALIGGASVIYGGSASVGGGGERIWAADILTSELGSAPFNWQDLEGYEDIWGSGYGSDKPMAPARDLDKTKVWLLAPTNKLLIPSDTSGTTFNKADIIDISGTVTGNPYYFFTVDDFGYAYIISQDTGVWKVWESTDMETWAQSSDTRLDGYIYYSETNRNQAKFVSFFDGSGFAIIVDGGLNNVNVLVTR